MKRLSLVVVAVSTLIMLLIIIACIAWSVANLTSQSVGEAIFVGIWTLVGTTFSVWIGLRLAQPLIRRNREYAEQVRQRRRQ
jgi:putative Mn2+ efflux pump MntP